MNETIAQLIGAEVLIRLRPGLDERTWGSRWRIGTIVGIGPDLLGTDVLLQLDDGSHVYSGHISFVEVLTRADVAG